MPALTFHSDNQLVADRVSPVVNEEIQEAVTAFKNRIQDADPGWPEPLRLDVVAQPGGWRQFTTIRLEETSVVGWDRSESAAGLPIVEYAALVFDTRTGERVLPTDLFTDVDKVTARVRTALVATHPDKVTADQLAALSLQPSEAGSTTPLSCDPTADGLHCLVDDGALTPDYPGALEATVPWNQLSDVLAPGVTP